MHSNFTNGMIKPPFDVRTETPTNNSGYFVTASGGFVQNLVFGFTGLRIQDKGLVEAYGPVLPPEWKSMTLKDITFRGRHYDMTVDRDADGRVRLTRRAL
jgi:trehalose/maltose hydrolase-like predicted phosphorylase